MTPQVPDWIREFCQVNAQSNNGLIRSAFENCIKKLNEGHTHEMKNQLKEGGGDSTTPQMSSSELVAALKSLISDLDAGIINEDESAIQKALHGLLVLLCMWAQL